MNDPITAQVVIAVLGMAFAAIGAYVIIKVSLAKVETTLTHHTEQIGEIKLAMDKHLDVTIHPSRDQITSLGREIIDFKLNMAETHERIELKVDRTDQKLDRLFEVILQTPQERRKTRAQNDDE